MKKNLLLAAIFLTVSGFSRAQTTPVILEAESGLAGSDWETKTENGITYLASKTNVLFPNYPGGEHKVVTFKITFPKGGEYDLYLKARVGSGGVNDDSFFYATKFGARNPAADNYEWITVNGLAGTGYTDAQGQTVVDHAGTAGKGEWKWMNISKMNAGEHGVSFRVKDNGLTQTFMIGGREDGLEIDKLAFCDSAATYTVQALNGNK